MYQLNYLRLVWGEGGGLGCKIINLAVKLSGWYDVGLAYSILSYIVLNIWTNHSNLTVKNYVLSNNFIIYQNFTLKYLIFSTLLLSRTFLIKLLIFTLSIHKHILFWRTPYDSKFTNTLILFKNTLITYKLKTNCKHLNKTDMILFIF